MNPTRTTARRVLNSIFRFGIACSLAVGAAGFESIGLVTVGFAVQCAATLATFLAVVMIGE